MNLSKIHLFTTVLAAGVVTSLATPTQAQVRDVFDNQAIQFAEDTIVEFEFVGTHGSFQSTIGIRNETTGEEIALFREVKPYDDFGRSGTEQAVPGQNNTGTNLDFVGTIGDAVQPGPRVNVVNVSGKPQGAVVEFPFQAGNRYTLYLDSVSATGQTRRRVLSTQVFANFDGNFASLSGGTRGNITGSRIAWEDGGQPEVGNDSDFDDFVLEAGGFLAGVIPCPPIR
ncbi:MAG: hypothetical protein SAL07_22010 [Oscillatoria sp. PMC 1051.18]|nr:hypothetical protein [Oscillatoria sp. PMC 1050.18]MEC5032585.1 hypothetical protein [Oscillatoria sp. PMC 1051.18]